MIEGCGATAGGDWWILRTDGGARGNPGPAGAAYVLEDPSGEVSSSAARFLGETTNNVAEYEALILGLRAAAEGGVRRLRVFADSELVVRQVCGHYKVRNEGLRPLHRRVSELVSGFEAVEVRHVRREENTAADALANEAMDGRCDVGPQPAGDSAPTLF